MNPGSSRIRIKCALDDSEELVDVIFHADASEGVAVLREGHIRDKHFFD